MWEGGGAGGQGVFMEPRTAGPAACVAQKCFKLTTGGTLCGLNTSKGEPVSYKNQIFKLHGEQ